MERRTLLSTSVSLTGDAGATSFYVVRSGDVIEYFQNQPATGSAAAVVLVSDLGSVTITGGSGPATLTLDYNGGDPIPGGLTFNGQSLTVGQNKLVVAGESGASFGLASGALSINGDQVNFSHLSSFDLLQDSSGTSPLEVSSGSFTFNTDLGESGATVDLTVDSGATVSFGATQHLDSVDIASGGAVAMLPAGGRVLDTNTLTVDGTLDLANNDLIVNTPSSGAMTTLQEQVAAGVNATATQGIIFSSTAATDGMTIGVAPAARIALSTLDGQSIPSSALVARCTYPGDATLDGIVNFSDFGVVAAHYYATPGITPPQWYSGDFNYDGLVNFSDLGELAAHYYAQIAQPAILALGTPLTTTLPVLAPDRSTNVRWDIDWGDGDVESYPAGSTSASHTYATTGQYLAQMTEVNASDVAFPAPATSVSVSPYGSWNPVAITAASADDSFNISSNTSGSTIITETNSSGGVVSQNSFSTSSLISVSIDGDTAGTTTVDFSSGDPLPPSGLSIDSANLDITGSSHADVLFTTDTAAVFGNAEIRHPAGTAVTFLNAGPGDEIFATTGTVTIAGDTSNNGAGSANGGPSVFVNTGATVLFTGTQHLSSLNIAPGGTARMAQDGTSVLVTGSLNISAGVTAPGSLPASISATFTGTDAGSTTLTWQGGATFGYFGYLPGASASNDVGVWLVPGTSVNPYLPSDYGFSANGFVRGQWTLIIDDADPSNAWGSDHVVMEQGYNISSGNLSAVGSAIAMDVDAGVTVSESESITLAAPLVAQPGSNVSGGVLDLADNDLIVRGGNLPQIVSYLAVGYDGTKWDGEGTATPTSASILSSVAAADPQQIETLGYAKIGSGTGNLSISSFDSQSVSSGDVVVKFTYYGDTNLDGAINATDLAALNNGYTNALTGWTNGDFNYDGSINGLDYTIFDNIYTAAPTGLGASAVSPNEIDLSWTNNASATTANEVMISTDGIQFAYFDSVSGSQHTYAATGLIPGTPYTFEVVADGTYQDSDASNTASATTQVDPWHSSVSGSSTVSESGSYVLTLSTDPSSGAPAFDHWTIDWGDGTATAPDIQTVSTADTTVTHDFGSTVASSVIETSASTANGAATPLEVSQQPIAVDVVPNAPSDLGATMQSSTEIDLSWTNNSQIASGFEILRSDNAGPFVEVDQVDAGTTTYDDTSVSPSDSAQYEVMATGAGDSADTSGGGGSGGSGGGGSGGNSSPATSPTVVTPTGKPTLAAELGPAISETIVLTWTYAGNDDAGFEIEEYDPAVDANFHLLTPVGAVDASGQGSMNVDGLTGGDTYSFRIRVDRNDGTVSDYSAGSAVTLPIANAPGLSVEPVTIPGDDADPADTELRVGWSGILPGHGVQIEEKSSWIPGNGWSGVWYGDQRSGDWPEDLQAMSPDPAGSSSGDQGFALDPGGSNPGTYIYRIRSTDAYGNPTAWSQIESGAIPGGSGPAPDAQVSGTTITVSWPAIDGPSAVTYGQDADGPLIGNGATIPYLTGVLSADQSTYTAVMENLLPGTKYDLVLCTLASSDGTGVPTFGRTSETTAGTVPVPVPASPATARAVYDPSVPGGQIKLSWANSSNNESGFEIFRVAGDGTATFVHEVDADVTTYLYKPQDNGPYSFRIAAVNYNQTFSGYASASCSAIGGPDVTQHLLAISVDLNAQINTFLGTGGPSYCQKSWMKSEAQAAIFSPSLKIVPAITAGSNVLPLSFRQWF